MTTYKFTPPFEIWDLLIFRALRLWPNDEGLQTNFLRHAYRIQEAELESKDPESMDMPDVIAHLKGLRNSLGGRKTLNMIDSSDAIDKNILKRTEQGQLAGLILTIAYQLVKVVDRPDLASWNKIVWLIERASRNPSGGFHKHIPRHSMVKAWKDYECVAHLWAAHMFFGGYWHKSPPLPNDIDIHSEMEAHLALAHTLQIFGTEKTINRAKKSFINDKTICKIDLPLECDFQTPFPKSWIPILEAYVSPRDNAN